MIKTDVLPGNKILIILLVLIGLLVFLPAAVLRADSNFMPDGIDAVTCAVFGNIPAVVEGPTVVEFWWRGSDSGVMFFTLNGIIQAVQKKDNGWQKYKLTINDSGIQHIKWVYKSASEV